MSPGLAAVIVNWNAGAALLETCRSLRDELAPEALEIVVVDNASSDGSLDELLALDLDVRAIRNEDNRGLAAANNQGLRATSSPYVLISNPDVRYLTGAIAHLVDLLDRRPRAAWAVARLEGVDGTLQTAAGDLPTLADALLGRQVSRRRGTGARSGFWWDGWDHDEEVAIGHGMEAAYLVRRAAIDEIGLQDERYPLDWEGIDWAERAGRAGWEIWFCPEARVVHRSGASIRQAQLRWVVLSHRGIYRYFADRRPLVLRPVIAVLVGGRGAVKAAAVALGPGRYQRSHPHASASGSEVDP